MRAEGRESFEAWARARQQSLVRTTYLLTGDFHRAEDLVQEALVRAATRWDTLRDGNPDAWMRTVIYREHVSWWRRTRRESTVATDEVSRGSASAPPPPTVDREAGLVLTDALALLTRGQRAALLLRYVEDLTAAQAADVLGVSVGTVKKQTSLALARLREVAPELEDLLEDPR